MLFTKTEYDKLVYENELKDFLPKNMIDIHTHVWRDKDRVTMESDDMRSVSWPNLVALDNSIEDIMETYRIMFPDKNVKALMFGTASHDKNSMATMNAYISESAKKSGYPALYYSHPKESAEEIEEKILSNGFLGVKSYLDLADPSIPENDIRIFDFFPHHQLKKLNEMGAIMMLHIPRPKRLKDEYNLKDIKEITQKYPDIKLIIAHIGRAYIPSDMGNAMEYLSDCKNLLFDFCANTSDYAMEQTLRSVGSTRLMFGSDLPITRMRMRRIEENGTYVNLVPPKIYGEFDPAASTKTHMREVSPEEAEKLTYFMYEEIRAMKRAVAKVGMGKDDVENLFFNNANELISSVKKHLYK